jgi:hypothetical protein
MERFTKIVLFVLVAFLLVYPIIERVDFWDNWLVTGQDLELSELSMLLILGSVLAFRVIRLAAQMIFCVLSERIRAAVAHKACHQPDAACSIFALLAQRPGLVMSLRV